MLHLKLLEISKGKCQLVPELSELFQMIFNSTRQADHLLCICSLFNTSVIWISACYYIYLKSNPKIMIVLPYFIH